MENLSYTYPQLWTLLPETIKEMMLAIARQDLENE